MRPRVLPWTILTALLISLSSGCFLLRDKTTTEEEIRAISEESRGIRLFEAGNFVGALGVFNSLIAWNPQSRYVEAYYERGRTRLALGDWDGAIADLQTELAVHPGNWEPFLDHVQALIDKAQRQKAEEKR